MRHLLHRSMSTHGLKRPLCSATERSDAVEDLRDCVLVADETGFL
ncbi:hypothetical protein [Alloactinosynnema sp. L-07]|nr:hypothetical protein [Alloactinosynnema sp. L-07]